MIDLKPIHRLAERVQQLLDRVEPLLPPTPVKPDFAKQIAFRWRKRSSLLGTVGYLEPVRQLHRMRAKDLQNVDEQKRRLFDNTAQFVAGRPANNVLLSGSRGSGKSSLVKATLDQFHGKGLRMVEVDRDDLVDLPDIVALLSNASQRFIVFADDLSFEAGDPAYKALKSVLDGGLAATAENVLIYATSNRRHLMPEFMSENLQYKHTADGEVHPGETTEEKISLSERFGLWLSFYPFSQDEYLAIAQHWVTQLGGEQAKQRKGVREAALLWSLERASRSGRVAYQFARDWVGQGPIKAKSSATRSLSETPSKKKAQVRAR
jgi:uncharacterized protein